MTAVKYSDLMDAFVFVSAGPPMDNQAYIAPEDGEIYWLSELNPDIAELQDTPDDLTTSDRYIAIPHKNDLDLGKRLALRFAMIELAADDYDQAERFFRHPGAYAHFKDLLQARGLLDKWHEFEDEACERELRDWCEVNGIRIIEDEALPLRSS